MRWIWIAAFATACRAGAGAPAPSAPVTQRALPPAKAGPATHVVTLAPGSPTPIVRGPFEITTIKPAGDLELGISRSAACDGVVWFAYSGGGAAVAEGEILCARSGRSAPVTQGFSGH
jgi:hypothetical protein